MKSKVIRPNPPQEDIAPLGRIGFLALATDYNSEQDLRHILPKGTQLFTNRVANANPMTLENLRAMAPDITRAAAGLLPGFGVDAVIYGCTSGTAAIGEEKVEAAIRAAQPDVPVTNPLKAACAAGPDAILAPKINTADDVKTLVAKMEEYGAPASTALWCMMETPLGILNAQEIGAASDRVAVWVMGTNDIAKDTGAHHTPGRLPMITSLGICMLAARAYGIQILDGVYNDIKNEQGFADICQQGLELGFDGKTLIHPSQVGPCNDTFLPSDAQLEGAKKIVAGFEEARHEGKGVVTVDGRMIEELHVEQARKQLALAEAVKALAGDLN